MLLLLWLLQLPLTFLLTDAILSLWALPLDVVPVPAFAPVPRPVPVPVPVPGPLPGPFSVVVTAAVAGVVNMRSFPFNSS